MTTEKILAYFTIAIPVLLLVNTVMLTQVFAKLDKLEAGLNKPDAVPTTCTVRKDNYWYGVERTQTMECNTQ
jgi:hypothetical protein